MISVVIPTHNSAQSLPRSLLAGTGIVLVLYIALNAVFLRAAPMASLAGQLQVASIAGSYMFGELGGQMVAAMICIGLVPSIAAMMWIGPRVTMTMGEDVPALAVFARRWRSVRTSLPPPAGNRDDPHGRLPAS